jgi:hypothetical protein
MASLIIGCDYVMRRRLSKPRPMTEANRRSAQRPKRVDAPDMVTPIGISWHRTCAVKGTRGPRHVNQSAVDLAAK